MTDESQDRSQQFVDGCRNYTFGFALALFGASSFFAWLIIWGQALPGSVHEVALPFFTVLSLAGVAVVAAAYLRPVGFYQLLEGDNAN